MKNFRVQIRAHGYYADFTVMAEDNAKSIENSILDKLGTNAVKWESTGDFYDSRQKYITYEEVIYDPRSIQTEEVLGVKLGARV